MFFFFKQKTAYEMRISDWSSDVCSSDLLVIIEDALARYLDPPGMPVDPHNLATKPQLDIAFLIKAGMAQWQTADVSRDLERPLAQGGPRSAERRVGKECVSTGRSRGAPDT